MNLLNPLNSAAGGVPVPDDQREIQAALRAGEISYRMFPYLRWRYGERGERFTRSDSAWLAWLTRYPPERVNEQIAWLRNVLSNRGMPSWILEMHLRVLYRQLVKSNPKAERKYSSLLIAADQLHTIAEASIPAHRVQQLVDDFSAAIGSARHTLTSGAARLLLAALADERSQVQNAVRSLNVWLSDVSALRKIKDLRQRLRPAECLRFDSEEFQERWVAAIDATIQQLRDD